MVLLNRGGGKEFLTTAEVVPSSDGMPPIPPISSTI
eukprot:CAMPEP_0176362912 /NCGR_PEP_ID=MMETSP0126-20121128/18751_1 /TAXON_ID=141414 ORGANISM="Strombidinopsis acuminatum, Strain SPMC142" /NCGR_SAMPLE_ID=MMETSP0126 /ASSEMBLY_ACC=CAM_ASM_000229 /LENGTH=35 /DNA_ID= /DNA_START= /DNA_END= /DNA_ORIENTATION=